MTSRTIDTQLIRETLLEHPEYDWKPVVSALLDALDATGTTALHWQGLAWDTERNLAARLEAAYLRGVEDVSRDRSRNTT